MDQLNDISSLSESPRRVQQDQVQQGQQDVAQGAGQGAAQRQVEAGAPRLESALATSQSPQSTGFKDIPVGQKLALIALSLLLPIGLLLYFATSRLQQDIAFAIKERQGVEYLIPLRGMLEHLVEHKALAYAELRGLDVNEKRSEELADLDSSLPTLQTVTRQYGAEFDTTSSTERFIETWESIKRDITTMTPEESNRRHDELLKEILLPLIVEVGNKSNLILDPSLDSYYTMDLVVNKLPAVIDTMGDGLYYTMYAAAQGQLSQADRNAIQIVLTLLEERARSAKQSKEFIVQYNPAEGAEVATLSAKGEAAQQAYTAYINQNVLAPATVQTDAPTDFFENLMATLDTEFEAFDTSFAILDTLLENRIQGLQRQSLFTLAGVAASLLLAFIIIYFITRQITRPLSELNKISDRLAQGDFSQVTNIESRDEIGTLASSFNNAILQLRDANTRQDIENERAQQLQTNIGEFLNVAMDIAQGDFTKRGQVSEDALGNVVDAINFMTEELGYVLKDVQDATQSVNQGATDMFGTANSIARSAEVQAVEAQKAREDVQDIRSTMRQVSEEMNLSAESANRALTASKEGQQAVVQTLSGMQDIRREVQAVSKRVKSLGDRSLEISEIVETISRISEQTNLLAVNAAIESSGAGEAGLRFSVVADQVRKLAEESAYAAERVSILIKTVQDEVQEVITGVEAGTREVEEGYRVASQAGQRLEDIASIVEKSASLAQRISQATQDQVTRVEQVGQVVEQMAEISQESQVTVTKGREAAERLQQLAAQLETNLSRFRLA